MLPIATATSHLAVRRNEITMLTTMQINRHVIDLATDLFLVSLMILSYSYAHIKFLSNDFTMERKKRGRSKEKLFSNCQQSFYKAELALYRI
jgi:hypothetical protein